MHRALPDYLRPGLDAVFVGINPGEWAARTGHYYANPRNRFWEFLHQCGLTCRQLKPEDDGRVVEFGLGLTDRVKRWTKSANELDAADFERGAKELRERLAGNWPRVVAFNGKKGLEWVLGYRPSFGPQEACFGESTVFVLPSTSPANAGLTHAAKLCYFRELARLVKCSGEGDLSRA